MRMRVAACLLAGVLLLVTATIACGGTTNQTETPGQPTSAAPLPSASPTGGGGGGASGSPSSAPAADGAEIFAANCTGCHGAQGQGGFGPNIQNVSDVNKVQTQVTNGRGQMPAFKGQLTPAEITAVAQYVAGGLK